MTEYTGIGSGENTGNAGNTDSGDNSGNTPGGTTDGGGGQVEL